MKKQRICLNMIVKNESKVILDCLKSIYHLIDYYVINDTGSTDDTIEKIKNFFNSKKIKGEIIEHEFRTCICHGIEYKKYDWFHFGWNRTYALNACKGKSEYIFFMDADDIIEGTLKFPPILKADQYYLNIKTDFNIYTRPQLIKNDPKLNWKYEYGLHECLEGNPKLSMKLIGDYAIISRRLGFRNEDALKYYNDAKILKELMEEDSSPHSKANIRYKYYYAQSWFDAKEYEKAILGYKDVINTTEDDERLYSCRYMIGRSHLLKKSNSNDIEKAFIDCYENHKNRSEPLYQLCMYFNGIQEYQKAYDYGIKGIDIKMPINTYLFIDKSVYDYRLMDELVLCASNIGKYHEALKYAQCILRGKKFPTEYMVHLQNNLLILSEEIEKKHVVIEIDKEKPSLCFYLGPSPINNKNKFGSELAVEYLSLELLKNYNVFISGDLILCNEIKNKVNYINTESIKDYYFDIMIVSRYINYFIEFDALKIAKKTYIWMHDIGFHTYWNNTQISNSGKGFIKNVEGVVSGYITLSEWHKEKIINDYDLDKNKVHIIGNGINPILLKIKYKNPNKFIWVSNYDRGLVELINIFPKIIKIIPEATLDIYRDIPEDIIKIIKDKKYIFNKGQKNNNEIIEAFVMSGYFFYPTKWCETYCISALEAQYTGCVCITSNLAGLKTTVGDRGILLNDDIYSDDYWKNALEEIEKLHKNPELKLKIMNKAHIWAKTQTWEKKSLEWIEILGL